MKNTLEKHNEQIEELICNYEKLNDRAQELIRDYVEHLTETPKYCRLVLIKTEQEQKGGTI